MVGASESSCELIGELPPTLEDSGTANFPHCSEVRPLLTLTFNSEEASVPARSMAATVTPPGCRKFMGRGSGQAELVLDAVINVYFRG